MEKTTDSGILRTTALFKKISCFWLSPFPFQCNRSESRDMGGVRSTGSSGSRAGSARRSRGWSSALPCSLRQLHLARSTRPPVEPQGGTNPSVLSGRTRCICPPHASGGSCAVMEGARASPLMGQGWSLHRCFWCARFLPLGLPRAQQPGSTLSSRKELLPSLPPRCGAIQPRKIHLTDPKNSAGGC